MHINLSVIYRSRHIKHQEIASQIFSVFVAMSTFAFALALDASARTTSVQESGRTSVTAKAGVASDASAISKTYLQDSPKSETEPHILIGRFDEKSGLVAGFQASSGKRILFRARFSSGGAVIAQALHFDPSTGKIYNLIERSRSVDATGAPIKSIIVGGIDLASLLRGAKDKNDGYAARKERAMQFLNQPEGKALLEGIPALYAALDGVADNSAAQQLKQPFGAIVMGLQLGANVYSGLDATRRTTGTEKLAAMSARCLGEKECVYSGKDFSIYQSGLFDALSKRSLNVKRIAAASDLPRLVSSPDRSILSQINSTSPQLKINSVADKFDIAAAYFVAKLDST